MARSIEWNVVADISRLVAAENLRIGEAILVAPGGGIPVDGTVASGHSFVDESRIPRTSSGPVR